MNQYPTYSVKSFVVVLCNVKNRGTYLWREMRKREKKNQPIIIMVTIVKMNTQFNNKTMFKSKLKKHLMII